MGNQESARNCAHKPRKAKRMTSLDSGLGPLRTIHLKGLDNHLRVQENWSETGFQVVMGWFSSEPWSGPELDHQFCSRFGKLPNPCEWVLNLQVLKMMIWLEIEAKIYTF
jgi:hypothetical protein